MRIFKNQNSQLSDNRVLLFAILYMTVLIGLAFFAYSFVEENFDEMRSLAPSEKHGFYELPSFTVDVAASGSNTNSVHMEVSLKVNPRDIVKLQGYLPRIIDRIQTYMNTLRSEELRAFSNFTLLHEDLMLQLNKVSGPVRIMGIIIRRLVIY